MTFKPSPCNLYPFAALRFSNQSLVGAFVYLSHISSLSKQSFFGEFIRYPSISNKLFICFTDFSTEEYLAADSASTEQDTYIHFVLCLVKCGTKALRCLLEYQYGSKLDRFLLAYKKDLLETNIGKRNELRLFPDNNEDTNVKTWDISLLNLFFCTCSNLPSFVKSFLSDIVFVRTKIFHRPIPELDGHKWWKILVDAIEGIINQTPYKKIKTEIQQEILDILRGRFVNDVEECERTLRVWDSLQITGDLSDIKQGL